MKRSISNNLKTRLKLLKESNNYLQMLVSNKLTIPNKLLTEHKENLKVCKELLRKELTTTPITELLTTIKK